MSSGNVEGGLELNRYQFAKIGPGARQQWMLSIGVILMGSRIFAWSPRNPHKLLISYEGKNNNNVVKK